MRFGSHLISAAVIAASLHGCASPRLDRFEYTQLLMGVQARVVLYASEERRARSAAEAAFDRIAKVDARASDYRADSELTRLCRDAVLRPIRVSPDLYQLLDASLHMARASDGAFDPTIGPLSSLWRESRRSGRLPSLQEIEEAKRCVDWRAVKLFKADRSVRLARAGMRLDLGGIAKGYAADRAVEVLRSRGTPRCLVALAGDMALGDAPPRERGWTIELDHGGGRRMRLVLRDVGVSTSGDLEQYIEIDGRRYSHILDKATGLGMTTPVCASVVASDACTADLLATTACLRHADVEDFMSAHDAKSIVVTMRRGGDVVTLSTGAYRRLVRTPRPCVERSSPE